MFNCVNMPILNSLICHKKYQLLLSDIKRLEENRFFCKHDTSHFMDVARIMYIITLENNLHYDKETLYITAFFHDIGRCKDKYGNDHALFSQQILIEILSECQLHLPNIDMILDAIRQHRNESLQSESLRLPNLLFIADKLSRNCFDCTANSKCNWAEKKKNFEVKM